MRTARTCISGEQSSVIIDMATLGFFYRTNHVLVCDALVMSAAVVQLLQCFVTISRKLQTIILYNVVIAAHTL